MLVVNILLSYKLCMGYSEYVFAYFQSVTADTELPGDIIGQSLTPSGQDMQVYFRDIGAAFSSLNMYWYPSAFLWMLICY